MWRKIRLLSTLLIGPLVMLMPIFANLYLKAHEEENPMKSVGAFSGRIGLPPAVMGWAASCDDGS